MSSGLRALARLLTVSVLAVGYLALHLAITVGQDVQARDRFRDGPARAAAFTTAVDRYASGDLSGRPEIAATKAWFEENAPEGRARTTVSAAADLVGNGKGHDARVRTATLATDVGLDRAALDQDIGSQGRAALWLAVVAGVLSGPCLWLRHRRRAANAVIAQLVSRFAVRQPKWRRPLFLAASEVGYTLFECGSIAVATAQKSSYKYPLAVQILLLPLGLAAIGGGFLILKYARPRSARAAARALRADGRQPVLYLRSFADDHSAALVDDGAPLNFHSREEQLAAALGAFGPVIAVGRPGEPLPLLGAARFYLPLDDWKPTILRLMELSRLIVLRMGSGEGLRWEIEQVVATQPARKLLLLTPGQVAAAAESLNGRLPVPPRLEEVAGDAPWVSAAITFGSDWVPHVRAVEPVPGSDVPRGGLLGRGYKAVEAVFGEHTPAHRTVKAMKGALKAVGVRHRLIVFRSGSNMLRSLGRACVVIAVLVLLLRGLELAGL